MFCAWRWRVPSSRDLVSEQEQRNVISGQANVISRKEEGRQGEDDVNVSSFSRVFAGMKFLGWGKELVKYIWLVGCESVPTPYKPYTLMGCTIIPMINDKDVHNFCMNALRRSAKRCNQAINKTFQMAWQVCDRK